MATLLAYSFASNLNPTTTAANVSGGAITSSGVPITCVQYSGVLVLGTPAAPTSCKSAAKAVSVGNYAYFTLTANSGYVLNLSSLDFKVTRSGTSYSPRGWVVRSSVDSYGTNIATEDVTSTDPTYTSKSLDLSGASYQGLSSITLRIYEYAQAEDTVLFFDDLTLTGTVAESTGIPFFADLCGGLNDDLTGGM